MGGVPKERIQQLLRFVVIGAGPTGVELAAELYDYVYQDVAKTFPRRLLEDVSIEIIDLQEKILSAYDRRIAEYATDFFQRANIKCLLGAAVKEVKDGAVVISDRDGSNVREVPFGLAVWCTGIKLNPFCEKLISLYPNKKTSVRYSPIRIFESREATGRFLPWAIAPRSNVRARSPKRKNSIEKRRDAPQKVTAKSISARTA